MDLTIREIKEDIEGFKDQIRLAKAKLAALPVGYLPYQENKKRVLQRRELQDDISHIETLIRYAREGIEIRKRELN